VPYTDTVQASPLLDTVKAKQTWQTQHRRPATHTHAQTYIQHVSLNHWPLIIIIIIITKLTPNTLTRNFGVLQSKWLTRGYMLAGVGAAIWKTGCKPDAAATAWAWMFFMARFCLPVCSSCSCRCAGGCRYLHGGFVRWHLPCKHHNPLQIYADSCFKTTTNICWQLRYNHHNHYKFTPTFVL